MHTGTLNFLRLATFTLRFFLLLASVLIFGIFTYFISTRADHDMGFPKWISAVEGLSGAALIYSLTMTILTLPYGGHSTLATIALIMDMIFIPPFVAIAIMNRKVLKSCEGEVDTALGKGRGRSQPVGFGKEGFGVGKGKDENIAYMVRFDTACKLQKAAFYSSIASIVILLLTLLCHYYYSTTFRTARRQGLPTSIKGRSFHLWPFGHSAADEEKAFQERVKAYTAKGFSNRPDDVPVERPVQRRAQKQQYQPNSQREKGGGGGAGAGGKMKQFFSKMMPGRHNNGGESDEEPLQARYQYPHHDMDSDKYLKEGNTASHHGDERVPPGQNGNGNGNGHGNGGGGHGGHGGDDDDGYHHVDLNGQSYDDESHYTTPPTTSGRSPSDPTTWADKKRKEMEAERQRRAEGGSVRGYGKWSAKARQPRAADYAKGDASPRQQAAQQQQLADEQRYADRAKAQPSGNGGGGGGGGGGDDDPHSARSRMKQQQKRKKGDRPGQDEGGGQYPEGEERQQWEREQQQRQQQYGGNEHGQVTQGGTGKRGQKHSETADGPRKAGAGAGAFRDTPYGAQDHGPGAATMGKGVDEDQARRAYGY